MAVISSSRRRTVSVSFFSFSSSRDRRRSCLSNCDSWALSSRW